MTTEGLKQFLEANVPGFTELTVEGSGCAYHYTRHSISIMRDGRFLGAPITPALIATSRTDFSAPASDPDGVVFAYPLLEKAAQMGGGQDVFRLKFRTAVSAYHSAEREIERRHGLIDSRTVLILASEIEQFELISSAESIRNGEPDSAANGSQTVHTETNRTLGGRS